VTKVYFFAKVLRLCVIVAFALHAPIASAGTDASQQTSGMKARTDYTQAGYELMKEPVGPLSIGLLENDVVDILGKSERKSKALIWGADGKEHQSWHYPLLGIELGLVQNESKLVVERICLRAPCDYKTQRGIQIGSNAIEVRTSYESEINPQTGASGSTLVAGTIFGGIIFELKADAVSSIFIGASVE